MSITEKQCEEVDVNHVRHTDEPEGTNQEFVRVLLSGNVRLRQAQLKQGADSNLESMLLGEPAVFRLE